MANGQMPALTAKWCQQFFATANESGRLGMQRQTGGQGGQKGDKGDRKAGGPIDKQTDKIRQDKIDGHAYSVGADQQADTSTDNRPSSAQMMTICLSVCLLVCAEVLASHWRTRGVCGVDGAEGVGSATPPSECATNATAALTAGESKAPAITSAWVFV